MNSWMKWKNNRIILFILLGLIFLSHLPFIDADPDRNMTFGRGPFTDEGLNTIQARNWINHGELNLADSDNLLKTPLFGFPLAVTYKIFGISLVISRLHVLALLFIALILIGSDEKNRGIILIFSLTTLLQYQVFQSSHFSMAEMLSVAAILLAIHYLVRSFGMDLSRKSRTRQAILSATFISLCWLIKIQFIYIILLLPIVLIIMWFISKNSDRKIILRQGLIILATLIFFLLIYLCAWYLPIKEMYYYMMAHQSGRFTLSGKTKEYIYFNLGYHFLKGWMQVFIYVFLVFLVFGFIMLKRSISARYPIFFFSSLAWFLLEMHKLTMVYLPTRYQVSLFVSMGLLISVVANELFAWPVARTRPMVRAITISLIFILTSINIYNYYDTYRHRTFAIRETNKYLGKNLKKDDVVLGAWAPALTWDTKAKALPVWNNFLNYQAPVLKFHPKAIIAEIDEQDSEQAWSGQGINLREISDSTRTVKIGNWEVVIYWLH